MAAQQYARPAMPPPPGMPGMPNMLGRPPMPPPGMMMGMPPRAPPGIFRRHFLHRSPSFIFTAFGNTNSNKHHNIPHRCTRAPPDPSLQQRSFSFSLPRRLKEYPPPNVNYVLSYQIFELLCCFRRLPYLVSREYA